MLPLPLLVLPAPLVRPLLPHANLSLLVLLALLLLVSPPPPALEALTSIKDWTTFLPWKTTSPSEAPLVILREQLP